MLGILRRWRERRAACARGLTNGERALARSVFGDALDTARVRVHARPFVPGQLARTAIAPNGHVYFHACDHVPDFAAAPLHVQAWFVHELVHAWQHQQGRRVWLHGLVDRRYRYVLELGKPFARYGIEQQAEIVHDWFLLTRGRALPGRAGLDAYARVIPFAARD